MTEVHAAGCHNGGMENNVLYTLGIYVSSPFFVHRVITTSGVCWLACLLSTCTATKHSDVYTAETPSSPSSAVALLAIRAATLSCVIILFPEFWCGYNNLAVFGCQRICLPPGVATVRHSETDSSCMFKYSGDGKERKKEKERKKRLQGPPRHMRFSTCWS